MKKKRTAARIATPTNAAIAMPATAPRLSDEELSELLELLELEVQVLPEQVEESESLDVIVMMSSSAFSSQAHADTLKTPRS